MGVVAIVLVTEAERTQRTITILVVLLLLVACLLGALTAWYWHHTNPRRRARDLHLDRRNIDLTERQLLDLNRPAAPNQPPTQAYPPPRDPFANQQSRPFG